MANREPFAADEWYHCYNRGVDKRRVFESESDYKRFIQTLYMCNDASPVRQYDDGRARLHYELLQEPREKVLVSLAAYCLMPNHFHLLLQEKEEGGITSFMRKVGTAYTMYFNLKNNRVGNLFVKPFRSRRISHVAHFLHIPNYIHLNPAELFEPDWKEGRVKNRTILVKKLREYQYSSFAEYCGEKRLETALLDRESIDLFKNKISPTDLVVDASEYYEGLKW